MYGWTCQPIQAQAGPKTTGRPSPLDKPCSVFHSNIRRSHTQLNNQQTDQPPPITTVQAFNRPTTHITQQPGLTECAKRLNNFATPRDLGTWLAVPDLHTRADDNQSLNTRLLECWDWVPGLKYQDIRPSIRAHVHASNGSFL